MAEHKLTYSIEIIDKLFRLGGLLDYHCEKEYPVDKENESAVDVAWLFESGQKYPLFIFEVESKTTSSIPSNPLKIFGETNQKFEKPLFLFHLLLTGGQESGKIQQLERTYGTYNYRIYRFSLDEETNLIKDILSQHRRLTNSINVVDFLIEIINNWNDIDLNTIIQHIEQLGFEKNSGQLLPSYAILSKNHPELKQHFIRKLKQKAEMPKGLFEAESYESYFGTEWSIPIHLGLLSAFANDNLETKYFDDFKNWQEKSYYLKQIGPSFGLSRDYDMFVLGMAGSVLGLTATLFYKVPEAREYIAGELLDILEKAQGFGTKANLFNALWLLHISPDTKKGRDSYKYAKKILTKFGGIPESLLKFPPTNFIGFIEGDETIEEYGEKVAIPIWEDFREIKISSVEINQDIIFDLAINYLTDDEEKWNPIKARQI